MLELNTSFTDEEEKGCPFVKSRLHVVETLDKSDPDSVQIKAALLDQIREYEGCFQWPNVLQSGSLPAVSGAGIVGTPPQHDVAGYPDDYEDFEENENNTAFLRAAELGDINRVEELLP